MRLLFSTLLFALHALVYADAAFSPPVTEQEWKECKHFLEENGYIWIKNFFSAEEVAHFAAWGEEINAALQTPSVQGLIVVKEADNPEQACRVEDMVTCYPDRAPLVEKTVTTFLSRLLDQPHVLFKDKLNFKWPGGGAFDPHQDFPAFSYFAPTNHYTAMVCLDEATIENGCLQVSRDWQGTFSIEKAQTVLPYVVGGSNHGSIQPKYVDKIDWLQLTTSRSDLVLISSYVPHYSEPNNSQTSRRAMFFTYNSAAEGEYRTAYYKAKRSDPDDPVFHFGTPTKARGK